MNTSSLEFINGLEHLDMLNFDGDSIGLIFTSNFENTNINFYQRLALEKARKIGANAVYFRNFPNSNYPSKPQLYIFDFTSEEQDIVEIHKNIWSSTEVRLYLVITKTEIKLFNASKPVEQTNNGELKVFPFETIQMASDAIAKFNKYSAKKFDNGSFWEETDYDFGYKETAYEKLISQLKLTRNQFLDKIKLDKEIANKLLVLGILVKYLEERVDIDENGKETRVFDSDFFNQEKFGFSSNFTETIRKGNQYTLNLFEYLSNHFNGKIFYLTEDFKAKIIDKDLSPLADFLSGVLDQNQFVFWRLYSFNYLPIELISSIYEMFLEADKSSGVAYTPSYLVSFMIDECMPINAPQKDFKILDPACGSGIFLVSAYKRIIDWWRVTNYEKTRQWLLPGKENLNELKNLLKESIYGVDVSKEAVDLAIFSLSLTLCDILSPKVIWEHLRFDDLSNNVVGADFFDWYPNNTDKKFDLIIGNPPFIEYGHKKNNINSLIKGLKLIEPVPNNQSALLFTILGMNLVKKDKGLLSFTLPSGPLLYNNSPKAINFRQWLFSKYNIPQIVDFTYLSNVLFKNKGNEKNVAVSAFFLENKVPDENPIYHITVKKLKTAKERQYFEIDHYDFHKVSKLDALENPFVWKLNLLGGGRLVQLINRLRNFQTLKHFLDNRKYDGWVYGEGFAKSVRKEEISKDEIYSGKYKKADYITGFETIPTDAFNNEGIDKNRIYKLEDEYFYRRAFNNKEIFKAPHILIKESIGFESIPIVYIDKYLTFRNEIIGIHCPEKYIDKLHKIKQRIHQNQMYRFYLITTSGRAGVTKSTFPVYKQDIMNLPFPEDEKEIELTKFDEILINDILHYSLEFLGKDTNIKVLAATKEEELISFGTIFCEVLNSLFKTESKKYFQKNIYETQSFICSIFEYGVERDTDAKLLKTEIEIENDIAELVYKKIGISYRINRVVKIYDSDLIYLIKPKELRYWLQSIALRDADETIVDLYKAGY